jgi:putative protein-disulfide isomerase
MTKATFIYVYDALCGWCYGFSPVMQKLHEKYRNDFSFEVISGGMVTGERIGEIGKVAPYISWAYKDVENRTGVKFGEKFLDGILKDGTAIFSSIKPALALSVFKKQLPEKSVEFAHTLQSAIYFDGIEPDKFESYLPYAEKFGLDGAAFIAEMHLSDTEKSMLADFDLSRKLGVSGFPTTFFLHDKKNYALARGYTDFENIDAAIRELLQETAQENQ